MTSDERANSGSKALEDPSGRNHELLRNGSGNLNPTTTQRVKRGPNLRPVCDLLGARPASCSEKSPLRCETVTRHCEKRILPEGSFSRLLRSPSPQLPRSLRRASTIHQRLPPSRLHRRIDTISGGRGPHRDRRQHSLLHCLVDRQRLVRSLEEEGRLPPTGVCRKDSSTSYNESLVGFCFHRHNTVPPTSTTGPWNQEWL